LKIAERRPNGYRTYPPETALMLELITTAQKAGFSLDEIRTLLPSELDHWEHDALIEALRRKVADIEALEARLSQSKVQLVALIQDIQAKPEDMDCATNARRVLSHVLGKEMVKSDLVSSDVERTGKASRRHAGGAR
jgi:DNA-binding transcriptional MerR regulator